MSKVTEIFSFCGGIAMIFLGVGLMLMNENQSAGFHQLQTVIMVLLFVTGASTFAHILKNGLGGKK